MARVTIWNMSREDDDVLDNVSATEVNITSDIGEQTNAMEFVEEANGVEQDIVTFEESEEAVKELEDQVVENEGMLENNPENITEEIVAVAQEKYFITAAKLGYPVEDLMRNRISIESAKESPVQALRLSTEGVKETLKRMLEAIKNFFQKIGEAIRKLIAKGLTFFQSIGSKAAELLKYLEKNKVDVYAANQDASVFHDIFNKMPVFIAASGNKVDIGNITKFVNTNFPKELMTRSGMSNGPGFLEKMGGAIVTVLSFGFIKKGGISGEANFLKSFIESRVEDKTILERCVVVEAYKNYISVVINNSDNTDLSFEKVDLINENFQTPNKVDGLDQNNLIEICKACNNGAKNVKGYFDVVYQAQSNITNALKKFDNLQEDKSAEAQKEIRLMRLFGSKLAYSSISQYVNTYKALLDIVAKSIEISKGNVKAAKQQPQPQQ